jgi:hypothetical protein
MMMEMVGSHVTSVQFYQTVDCHIPKNSNLFNQDHKIMKFHMGNMAVVTWKMNQDTCHKNKILS